MKKEWKQILIYGEFFLIILTITLPFILAQTQSFFEDCATLPGNWDITSTWVTGAAGECYAKAIGTHSMTSETIDLSSGDILYANLSFDYDHDKLDSGVDYFRVYVNSSVDSWVLVFQTADGTAGSKEINLSAELPNGLDAGVHIRATCITDNAAEICTWDNINVTSYGEAPTECNPTLNEDWDISDAQVCNAVQVTTGTGEINILAGGTLTLTNGANVSTTKLNLLTTGDQVFINSGCELRAG